MNGTSADERAAEVAHYLERVRGALADLPPGELDELTDELAAHFADVAAETGEPLTVRLGPPEAYAAELRASAGLTSAETKSPVGLGATVRARATALDTRLSQYPAWVSLRTFLPELRPGWWVLRGMAAAYLLLTIAGDYSQLLLVVLAVAFAWVSVALGRRTQRSSRTPVRLVTYAANGILAISACALVVTGLDAPGYTYPASYEMVGNDLTNLYLYDSHGEPITDVQIFDQYGNPVDLPYANEGPSWSGPRGPVANVYPRTPATNDWRPAPRVPGIVPLPDDVPDVPPLESPGPDQAAPTPTAAATPSGSAEPSATPTADKNGSPTGSSTP